jgi:hypothetical protein
MSVFSGTHLRTFGNKMIFESEKCQKTLNYMESQYRASVPAVSLYACIWEVFDSNLGRDTGLL